MSDFIVGIKKIFFIWNLEDGYWQAYFVVYSLFFIYVLSTKNKKLIFLSLLGYVFSGICILIYGACGAIWILVSFFSGGVDIDSTKDEDSNKNSILGDYVCIDGNWTNTFDYPFGGKMYFDKDGESHVMHKDFLGLCDESGNRYYEIGPDMYSKM